MHCSNHPEIHSICLCANCFKGLCQTCAQLCEDKFACSFVCQERVQKIYKLNDMALKAYGFHKEGGFSGKGFSTVLLFGSIGLPITIFSAYDLWQSSFSPKLSLQWALLIMGIVFTSKAIYTYFKGIRL